MALLSAALDATMIFSGLNSWLSRYLERMVCMAFWLIFSLSKLSKFSCEDNKGQMKITHGTASIQEDVQQQKAGESVDDKVKNIVIAADFSPHLNEASPSPDLWQSKFVTLPYIYDAVLFRV